MYIIMYMPFVTLSMQDVNEADVNEESLIH